jgi:hypothetical protein
MFYHYLKDKDLQLRTVYDIIVLDIHSKRKKILFNVMLMLIFLFYICFD